VPVAERKNIDLLLTMFKEKDAEASHLRIEPSPYALAFVERFRRPSGQVQLISQTRAAEAVEQSPIGRGNVSLDIVVMIVGGMI
jgi:hypothetical protein